MPHSVDIPAGEGTTTSAASINSATAQSRSQDQARSSILSFKRPV
jgi:hypothetical protein